MVKQTFSVIRQESHDLEITIFWWPVLSLTMRSREDPKLHYLLHPVPGSYIKLVKEARHQNCRFETLTDAFIIDMAHILEQLFPFSARA